MKMASSSQPSLFSPLSLKSINGVSSSSSSKPNSFIPTILKTHPFKTLKISASSINSASEDQNPKPVSSEIDSESKDSGPNETGNKGLSAKDGGSGKKEVPLALKLAMEKAKEYKRKKGGGGTVARSGNGESKNPGESPRIPGNDIVNRKVSSIDFVGLNFSDKKQNRGLPAGLVPMENSFSEELLSKAEIIVGDTSNFGTTPPEQNKQDDSDLYKPKVSTWGVFPRPNNISKTFGGGRTIRPGDVLETAEDKIVKDARTKQLVTAYKNKMGLNIDPKLKSDCEKALKDGDSLMDKGNLKEALPFYEKVMKELTFQSELHGLAALQWSICQDSLTRRDEARLMYEKLQSHPNASVKKKAKQFMFGFQAAEMLKVTSSNLYVNTTDYQNYFEAFVQDKTSYPQRVKEEEETDLYQQVLPYILFLACPIIFVLVMVARKGA